MLALLLIAALLPVPAHASGGGIPVANWGGKGATAPGRAFTYSALPSERGSVVQAVQRDSGQVDRWMLLTRRYGVPVTAYDGAMTGLSADGRVLVLSAARPDPVRSELVVFDRGQPGAPEALAEPMAGRPSSSVSDGRWSYTLFQSDRPWVEGLDTVTRVTRRWEVPALRRDDLWRLRLDGRFLRAGNIALTR